MPFPKKYRPPGSGEEYFYLSIYLFFAIYSNGGHLGHVTWTVDTNFRPPPFLRMLHMKIGFDWPSGSVEKNFEIVVGRRTDAGAWSS